MSGSDQSLRDAWVFSMFGIHPDAAAAAPPRTGPATPPPATAHPAAAPPAAPHLAPLDKDRAAAYLTAHAAAQPGEHCAHAVRMALLAGGLDIRPVPSPAKEFGPSLTSHGFVLVGTSDSIAPQTGDVAIIQNYRGGNSNGHAAMYSGTQWISDFRQRDVWGGPGFRSARPGIAIYRHP